MPSFSSPAQTTQPYIPVIPAAQRMKIPGMAQHFATLADLVTAVAAERTNIAAGLPLWMDGTRLTVTTEIGVYRTWKLDSAGADDAAKAAASHGRAVTLRSGVTITLTADTSAVLATVGEPASASGANGDLAFDSGSGLYYTKAAGAWGAAGAVGVVARLTAASRDVALLGDSRLDQHHNAARTMASLSGFVHTAQKLCAQKGIFFRVPGSMNFAVSGNTPAQWLARIPKVIAAQPRGVVMGGILNALDVDKDPTVVDQASANLAITNAVNLIAAGCRTLVAAGIRVCLFDDVTSRGWTQQYLRNALALGNTLLREICGSIPGVDFVSLAAIAIDPNSATYSPRVEYINAVDNLHYNYLFGWEGGKPLAPVLASWFTAQESPRGVSPGNTFAQNARQLALNPLFSVKNGGTYPANAATTTNSSITDKTLNVGQVGTGALAVGQYLTGPNVAYGTKIVSGAGLVWQVNISQTAASGNINANTVLTSASGDGATPAGASGSVTSGVPSGGGVSTSGVATALVRQLDGPFSEARSTNVGNGTIGAVTATSAAKKGEYRLVVIQAATNAGAFLVTDPDGLPIGAGTVGTAFSRGGLSFTLADGSTDFAVGDEFAITVPRWKGNCVQLDCTMDLNGEVRYTETLTGVTLVPVAGKRYRLRGYIEIIDPVNLQTVKLYLEQKQPSSSATQAMDGNPLTGSNGVGFPESTWFPFETPELVLPAGEVSSYVLWTTRAVGAANGARVRYRIAEIEVVEMV